MSMTRREKRSMWKAVAFAALAFWTWTWGLMIEAGILHSWWSFIPVMSASVAGMLVTVVFFIVAVLWLLKLVLLGD